MYNFISLHLARSHTRRIPNVFVHARAHNESKSGCGVGETVNALAATNEQLILV